MNSPGRTIDYAHDSRVVMTLDAGGSSFRFSAMQSGKTLFAPMRTGSHGDDLERCLETLKDGFDSVQKRLVAPVAAISFAFPGPADYPAGIIGDLPNLPAFRGGVALGPMLAETFGVPVFINNDAGLFTYGEAMGGLLPWINGQLERAGVGTRYRSLFGVTLGTGFGGGFVLDGRLMQGSNAMASQVWMMRQPGPVAAIADEVLSIRGVRRAYAERAGLAVDDAPEPRVIAEIAAGRAPGDAGAAIAAYAELGEALGEALGPIIAMTDSLVTIGGGLAGAYSHFAPAALAVLRGKFVGRDGIGWPRVVQDIFDLEDEGSRKTFLEARSRRITIPGTAKSVAYDAQPRLGMGLSRLGTSEAIALGAYVFALRELDGGSEGGGKLKI